MRPANLLLMEHDVQATYVIIHTERCLWENINSKNLNGIQFPLLNNSCFLAFLKIHKALQRFDKYLTAFHLLRMLHGLQLIMHMLRDGFVTGTAGTFNSN